MSTFDVFNVAGSGMSAQSVRLNTVASNLANAESVSTDPSQVYRAKHPVFQAATSTNGNKASTAVNVLGITESTAAPDSRYDPGNPLANTDGYVYSPNVNVVEEMADMISASRSYQNDVEVMNTARNMLLDTLKLGQS
jgi:flagellar basal-body rod protein FlgC